MPELGKQNVEQDLSVQENCTSFVVDYEKQIFDLRQLLEISKSLNSTLDYTILIDSILFICMAQMKVIKAGIFTKKGFDSTEFVLQRNFKGFDIDISKDYAIPEQHPLIKLFSEKYGCYTLRDIHAAIGPLDGIEHIEAMEPSLLVPLKTKGQINGVIILGERIDETDFDPYEREHLLNIATLAAISINNAFLFEMTTTDMMTKLKMKHYFFTVIQERYGNIDMPQKSFNIIMLDIDFFKRFNDTYGHACGDMVLVSVAKTISEHVRNTDIAARYGGEEFVVLIAEDGPEIAVKIAERIRKAIEEKETEYDGQKLKVTVSCGVASYNKLIDSQPKSVVDRADRALYISKQQGRNRVTFLEQ
ncbi:diguanylate cyclase DgcA [Gracilinema caldarium]|uniref:diguanylate cyclase n=1 Tax=Gracilinema caldarium (strain ATCC 51460 / DSM 7334 / H1) TaxID=744872 RepID=F8EWU4_GRAC1|nr:diguanylate cyclase DgcA [Gracilinema caldarium]AEJ18330.1 diguanylate cyclase [Gracilinema caldarium DSM 7334]